MLLRCCVSVHIQEINVTDESCAIYILVLNSYLTSAEPLHSDACVVILKYVSSSAAQRPVPTAAQAAAAAAAPAPSLVATPPARPILQQRPSATRITMELLRTRGLAGLYRGAGATLIRSDTQKT